jgi:Fe-Mn family superoxide dismutase
MGNIAWEPVYARYQQAVHAHSEALAGDPESVGGAALVIDVRRAGVFEQAPSMLPGARWRDPAGVDQWAAELPRDGEVLVYCVYGHEVGRSTAMRLAAAGVSARFLPGGIDAWQAAGKPVQPKS